MKREDLKALGLEDGVIDSIMALNGKAIETHKTAAQTAQAELETIKAQLTEANTQIEGFKSLDIEGVKKAADDWKAKAEQATKDAAAQLAAVKFDYALESALTGAKAKSAKAVQALLSTDTLKDANGEFIAERFTEQLEKIKSEHDYLFTDATPAPQIVKGGGNQSVMSDPQLEAMRKGAGLTSPK